MKQGTFGNLQELAMELERQAESKRDVVVDTRDLIFETDPEKTVDGVHPSNLHIQGDGSYDLKPLAQRQITDRCGIPAKYADRMARVAPALLDENVKHWFQKKPERRMVRQLDGFARAFLSDRFELIDNYDVAEATLPHLINSHVKVMSCDVTDTKLYLKAVSERITGEVKKGDVVQMGICITNSEVGLGAFSVQPYLYTLACTNGMIVPKEFGEGIHKRHLGKQKELGILYQQETILKDNEAFMLKLRDIVQSLVSQDTFDDILRRIRLADQNMIEGNPHKAIEVVGKQMSLTNHERDGVLRHLVEGGSLSQWGVASAITRQSQDVESYDRASELEEIGGKIIELPPSAWREIAVAA